MKGRILWLQFFWWSTVLLAGGRIIYPAKGNINLDEGTVEAWVRLDFEPQQTSQEYKVLLPLFQFTDPEAKVNIVIAYSCPAGSQACWYLSLDSGGEKLLRLSALPRGWQKGEWHQIALTWKANQAKLYLDGKLVSEAKSNQPFKGEVKSGEIFIGDRWTSDKVKTEAVIDELRISNVERKVEELGFSGRLKPDPFTLLLEDFEQLAGEGQEIRTKPVVCSSHSGEKFGRVSGGKSTTGKFGQGLSLY
ncbi:MAG: LamG domain-containing protein [Candidatus Omnitrophica bacterium]|nr:LamG domain-containing protein [Candidatus Omnitrophota bacterium]